MAYEQLPLYKPTEHQTPEPKVDHSAQQTSEKKKEAIVPNLLQPESLHKNPLPELPHFNPDPNAPKLREGKPFTLEKVSEKDTDLNAPKLPNKLREGKPFTLEKLSEKDTDPNAPKLPNKLREPVPFSLDNRPKTTTPPNSNVANTVPNQTSEKVVRNTPIVPQQGFNPAIREPQALNTTTKAPDIQPAQEPSMQQATPIPAQRSPLTAPNLPLENVQGQPPLQQNGSPAMQQMKPSWQVPSSSVVFEKSPILWDSQAVANEGSPIIWSNNPQPVFGPGQSPVSQNAVLTNPTQQAGQKVNGKPAEVQTAQNTQPGAEVQTAQSTQKPGPEVAQQPKAPGDPERKGFVKDEKSEKKEENPWWQADPVVTSSAAGRAQRVVQREPGLLEQYRLNKGRVELHNHQGGVLPPGKIVDLAYSGSDKYKQAFYDLYSNSSQTDANGKQITPLSEDTSKQATVLKKQLQDAGIIDAQGKVNPTADAETYERGVRQLLSIEQGSEFDALYPRRRLLESKIPPKQLGAAILLELRGQDVNYAELQGLRPNGVSQAEWESMQRIAKVQVGSLEKAETATLKQKTLDQLNREINEIEAKPKSERTPEEKKVLSEAKQQRSQINEKAKKEGNTKQSGEEPQGLLTDDEKKSLNRVGDRGVVGIDINGPERHLFGEGGMDKFGEMHDQLKAKSEALRASGDANAKVVFRVHVGEGYQDQKTGIDHSGTGQKNVGTLLTKLEDMNAKGQLSDGVVLRLGHLTHASDAQLQRVAALQTDLRSKGVELFTEANLTSNEKTGTVKGARAGDQVLLKQLYHGVTPTINTDGGGVVGTTLSDEYEKAQFAIDKFKSNKLPVEVTGADGKPEQKFFNDLSPEQKKNFDMERIHGESERYRSNVVPHLPLPNLEPSRLSKLSNSPTARSSLLAGGLSTINHLSDGKLDRDDVGAIIGDTALGGGSSYASDYVSNRFFNNIPPGTMEQAEKVAMNQIAGETAEQTTESVGKRALGSVTDSKFRMGAKGGAIVDAVTSGVFSTFENGEAYRDGKVTAGQATANVAVDTGVGVTSGLAGMAAGAAIGSIIPGAGTVVGGLIGFGAGMVGSWLARSALDGSGFTNWAKEGLGGVLNNFNQPLGKAWDWTSEQTAAISDTTSKAWNATADGVSNAASAVAGGVSDAASTVAGGLGKAWSWVGG